MRRLLALAAAFLAGAVTIGGALAAQTPGDPCEATRVGDLVTIDLSTCPEVTPSTSAPPTTATATTDAGSSTTTSAPAGTTTVATTTTTATPPPAPTTEPPPTTTVAPTVPSSTTPATTSPPPSTTSTPTTTSPGGGDFSADFATASDLDRFVWQMFHGGVDPFPRSDQPRQWHGDHDMGCGAPTTLRTVNLQPEAGPGPVSVVGDNVWWCAPNGPDTGHVMTSTSVVAYAHIDFSPRQTFVDVTRVCWDMNRTEMGGRKWWQVSVIPEALFQSNGGRLDYVQPNLQGDVAVNGEFLAGDAFMLSTFRSAVHFQRADRDDFVLDSGAQATGTDKATRLRHCLTRVAGGTRLTIHWPDGREMADHTSPIPMPTGVVRVIFQDVAYDSIKGDLSFDEAQRRNSWHVDRIEVVGS